MAKERPGNINLDGEVFRATLMLINTRDRHGRPKLVTILHDDEIIDLHGDEEFLTESEYDEEE